MTDNLIKNPQQNETSLTDLAAATDAHFAEDSAAAASGAIAPGDTNITTATDTPHQPAKVQRERHQATRTLEHYDSSRPLPIAPGSPLPFGATAIPNGVNFSVFSLDATGCVLVMYEKGAREPFAEIRFPKAFQVGHTFTMKVYNIDYRRIEYGYRMFGENEPEQGLAFDPDNILLDPYAHAVTGRGTWGERTDRGDEFPFRGRVVEHNFDWQGDSILNTPIEDLIVYEMSVRGFTRHETSGVRYPGTYGSLVEKIPYLKELGVNAVELLPVFDFDEMNGNREMGEGYLYNYWGYSTINFFAPKAAFAAGGATEGEVDEFKYMVRELHRNGIEVILDVVYNHTAEGNEHGPSLSFKGIDNRTYYMLTPEGYYYNFSGTGNTFNCNHPAVINFIIDSLRHWVTEYHIDGFRFDLASILARREDGMPLGDPPLLKQIAHDPILGSVKLIAEPWDAGGMYQVGAFPNYGRWSEWNGKYRDAIRKFIRADVGQVPEMISRIMGSPDLYPYRGPIASINFIIAHDGFTLNDIVSYNDKHNEANGENNRDGANDNNSWNCGVEGETDDPEILALRRRQMKNAMAILMVSQGVPMFLMGDEIARTQNGNNNTYSQDNELNWMDWTLVDTNAEIFNFTKNLIAFRNWHPVLRHGHHLRGTDYQNVGVPDILWLDVDLSPEASADDRLTLAFLLSGAHAKGGLAQDNDVFVAMNMHWESQHFTLPQIGGKRWYVFANTGVEPPFDICAPGDEVELKDQVNLMLTSRSIIILINRDATPEELAAEQAAFEAAQTAQAAAEQAALEATAQAAIDQEAVQEEAEQIAAEQAELEPADPSDALVTAPDQVEMSETTIRDVAPDEDAPESTDPRDELTD